MAGKKIKFVYSADLNKLTTWKVQLKLDETDKRGFSVLASSEDRAILTVKEKYPGYEVICLGQSIIKTLISNEYGPY